MLLTFKTRVPLMRKGESLVFINIDKQVQYNRGCYRPPPPLKSMLPEGCPFFYVELNYYMYMINFYVTNVVNISPKLTGNGCCLL